MHLLCVLLFCIPSALELIITVWKINLCLSVIFLKCGCLKIICVLLINIGKFFIYLYFILSWCSHIVMQNLHLYIVFLNNFCLILLHPIDNVHLQAFKSYFISNFVSLISINVLLQHHRLDCDRIRRLKTSAYSTHVLVTFLHIEWNNGFF